MQSRRRPSRRTSTSASARVRKGKSSTTSGAGNRRGRGTPYSMLRPQWEDPIHQSRDLKLTYRDTGFTGTMDILNNYQNLRVFRGNGVYDPDYTGVGVQPYGYDQLFPALYNSNIVWASSIRVSVAPTPNTRLIRLIIIPSRNPTLTYRDVSDLRAFGNYRMSELSWVNGIQKGSVLRHYASTQQLFPEYGAAGEDVLTAQYNTNPQQAWHWLVFLDSSTTIEEASVQYDVEITYYLTERKTDSLNES